MQEAVYKDNLRSKSVLTVINIKYSTTTITTNDNNDRVMSRLKIDVC